ncbi:MAG: phosphoglycerate kinase, partial [bacterium]
MDKLFIEDLELSGKRVLLRVDFNVPLKNGKVEDDTRIRETLPTINKIISSGGIPVIISHLGRPKGKKDSSLSLKPVAEHLEKLLGRKVTFLTNCVGEYVEKSVKNGKSGDVFLLENLRFYKEEEENAPEFAKALASLADLYINDAFATAHRAHASTVGVTKFFKQNAAGYLMAKEIESLSTILEKPPKPFVAIIGGAKISTKLPILKNLLKKVDKLLIGGGLSYTFFKALGVEIGKSICEDEQLNNASEILQSPYADKKIVLPIDVVVTDSIDSPKIIENVSWDAIPANLESVDIGKKTRELYTYE